MNRQIAIVPMDNRAYTTSDPTILGKISGWTVINPPVGVIGNDLENETDVKRLGKWLESVSAEVSCIIIPIDLLLYGGCIRGGYKTITDRHCEDIMEIFAEIKRHNPECCIYVFKIMHGISSLDLVKDGVPEKTADDICEYFELLAGIKSNEDDSISHLKKQIPGSILSKYQAIRSRHLEIDKLLIGGIKNDVFDYLLFTQADVPERGLHLLEQKILMESFDGFYDRIEIATGLDESIFLLMARYVNQKEGLFPKYFLKYSSVAGPQMKCLYEDRALDDNIKNHIAISGGICVDTPESADCILMVHSAEGNQRDPLFSAGENIIPNRNLWSFVSSIQYYFNNAKKVAIIDAALVNGSDELLISILKNNIDLRDLSGYSGWNTAANSIGTVLAQVSSQLAGRTHGVSLEIIEHEKERFLLTRFLNDWLYQGKIRKQIINWIKKELKVQPWELGSFKGDVEKKIREEMESESALFTEKYFPNWINKKIEIGLPRTRATTLNIIIGDVHE